VSAARAAPVRRVGATASQSSQMQDVHCSDVPFSAAACALMAPLSGRAAIGSRSSPQRPFKRDSGPIDNRAARVNQIGGSRQMRIAAASERPV